jgi:hypothetical protein
MMMTRPALLPAVVLLPAILINSGTDYLVCGLIRADTLRRRKTTMMTERQELAGFAGIMIAVGAVFGILSGHGLVVGALAGALLFGLICGVGWIGNFGSPGPPYRGGFVVQRDLAAFLAISLRFFFPRAAARAFPPFLPSATAAGSFPSDSGLAP